MGNSIALMAQLVVNEADSLQLPRVELQTVEITALREPGRLNQLPVSAAVLGTERLQRHQVTTLKDAVPLIANVFMPDYGSRLTSPVYIRGIGSRINAPSVGLYVDNIPYFEKSVFDFDLLNAERLEVLRGPQGTLYGRNTMGGLINVTSQSPFRHQGTDIMLGGGNPAMMNAQLTHARLLSNKLGVSVSTGLNRHEGFFENEHLGQKADAHLSAGGRIRLSWQVNASLMAELTSHYEYLDQGGYPYAVLNTGTDIANPVSYNEPSSYQRQMSSNGLLLSYSTPQLELRSVSALQYFNDKQAIDQDFTPYDLVFAVQKQDQWMLSQEFTARSNMATNRYQWIAGVFAFRQSLDNDLRINFGQDAVSMRLVPGTMQRWQLSGNNVQGAAAFHQSSLKHFLLQGMTLTAGLRIDYEEASLDHGTAMHAEFPTPPPTSFFSRLDFFQLLPRLTLNYAPNQNTSVYAAVVRGYKTGGFNVVFEAEEDRSFDPEHSWNYEAGYKGMMLNNRLSLQAALFYIDWQNQQIYQMLPSGQGSMLKNAGVSVSKGFEFDIEAIPLTNLLLRGSVGYTHASFVQNTPGENVDLSGNFIPYVPRYTTFAGMSYTLPLRNSMLQAIGVHLSYRGVGTQYWNDTNTRQQDPYGLLNASISLETEMFSLDVFANNITSAQYHAFSFAALGNHYVQPGRPATMGVRLNLSF